jgi:hypothetical protein
VPKPDIVVVPGGVGTRALLEDKAILEWLRKVYLCLSLMSSSFSLEMASRA